MKKILIFIIFLMANNGFAQIVPWDTNGTINMRFDNYFEDGFLTVDNTTFSDRILVKIKGRYDHNRPSAGARTTNYPDISLSRITSEPGNISKIQIVKYGGNYAGIKDKFSFKAPNNLPVYLPNTIVNEMFSSQTIARFSQEVAPSYCQPAEVCTLALPEFYNNE